MMGARVSRNRLIIVSEFQRSLYEYLHLLGKRKGRRKGTPVEPYTQAAPCAER